MAVGDIAQVAIRYRSYGQTMVNVPHFRQNTATTGLDELVNLFTTGGASSLIELLANLLNNQTRITDLRAVYVRGGAPIEETLIIDRPGDLASTAVLPNTVAVNLSCRSALIGRSNRGRMYLPAPTGGQIDQVVGLWTVAFRASIQTFIDSWQVRFTSPSPWTHVIWSPTLNESLGAGYVPPVVSDILIDPVPRGQRRRAIELGSF